MTVAALAEQMAALKAQMKQIEDDNKKEGVEAWESFKQDCRSSLTWSIKWVDKYVVRIGCEYSPESKAKMAELDSLYPNSYSRVWDDMRGWRGMTYYLVGNVIIQTGGGHVVLDIARHNGWEHWQELTPEQESALRSGIVPDDLKSKWVA